MTEIPFTGLLETELLDLDRPAELSPLLLFLLPMKPSSIQCLGSGDYLT